MRLCAILLALLSLGPGLAWAGGHEPVSTMPTQNASFLTNLQSYLRDEGPAVQRRVGSDGAFVRSGGLHSTAASCTASAIALEAFTSAGNRITADGGGGTVAINYGAANIGANCANPGSDVCWVVGSAAGQDWTIPGGRSVVTLPTLAGSAFNRVGSSNLYADCTSASQPVLPADSVYLAKVTITNGAIAAVSDLRLPASYVRAGVLDVTDPLYGAVGDNSTNDTTAIQTALNAAGDQSGKVVLLPAGTFKTTSALSISKYTTLRGLGSRISTLHAAHTGNAVTSTWAVNASTGVWIRVESLGFEGDAGSTGAAFMDRGGSFVDLTGLFVHKFKYGVIFDQTEVATIDTSVFDDQSTAGIWLVNGPDHDATATNYNWTNRITVSRNQFNTAATAGRYNMVDDGGVAHTIRDNNFNGGFQNLRVAGSEGAIISGNEFEGSDSTCLTFQNSTLAGTTHVNLIDPRGVVVSGNVFAPQLGNIQIEFVSASSVTLLSNFFGSDGTAAPSRIKNTHIDYLFALGNEFRGGVSNGGTYTGGATYGLILDAAGGAASTMQLKTGLQVENPGTPTTGVGTGYVLNNYEEGTFTPALACTGCTFVYAAAGQIGYYLRVGRLLWVTMHLELAAGGSTLAGNTVTITGLPFAAVSGPTNSPTFPMQWTGLATAVVALQATKVEGGTIFYVLKTTAAATSIGQLLGTDLNHGATLKLSGSYMTLN